MCRQRATESNRSVEETDPHAQQTRWVRHSGVFIHGHTRAEAEVCVLGDRHRV